MVVGRSQKSKSVLQNLERPLAEHQAIHLRPLFEDFENEILLLQPGVLGDIFLLGENDQILHRQSLKFGDVDVGSTALDLFVTPVRDEVNRIVIFDVDDIRRLEEPPLASDRRFPRDRALHETSTQTTGVSSGSIPIGCGTTVSASLVRGYDGRGFMFMIVLGGSE